jgi:hypothetical protein
MNVLHYVNESSLSWQHRFLQLLKALEDKGVKNTVLCAPGGTLSEAVEN